MRTFSQLIAWKWSITHAKPAENFQRSWNIGPSGALTEVGLGSQDGQFLGDGDVDELIQRRILGLGNTAQLLQQ